MAAAAASNLNARMISSIPRNWHTQSAAVMRSDTRTPCPSPFDTRSGWRAPMFCPAKVAMVF